MHFALRGHAPADLLSCLDKLLMRWEVSIFRIWAGRVLSMSRCSGFNSCLLLTTAGQGVRTLGPTV